MMVQHTSCVMFSVWRVPEFLRKSGTGITRGYTRTRVYSGMGTGNTRTLTLTTKFQPIFNLKAVLNSQKIGESIFGQSGWVAVKVSPLPNRVL